MELADAHCHLLDPWFSSSDIPNIIKNASSNNVKTIINVGSTSEHYNPTISSAKQFDQIFANIGLQPTHVNNESFSNFQEFIRTHKNDIKAIGEVGLDYYWVKEEKQQEIQRKYLVNIINFANELKLPLVIHSRSAELDAVKLLSKHSAVPVLMHCFEGNLVSLQESLDNNFIISVPTSVKNRKSYRKIAKNVPLAHMTLETDAPFQSPFNGINGTKPPQNEPKNILISCEKVAQIHNVSIEEVAKITTNNTKKFFNIL
ncbi:MAG: TatD family hydrolase [Candidatus Hodarchaeales archaeon]